MSDEHYSTLDDFVGELQNRGFSRKQIRDIANHEGLDDCSYGGMRLMNPIGGYVSGAFTGGLIAAICHAVCTVADVQPGPKYFLDAISFILPFSVMLSGAHEELFEKNEKFYNHLSKKFPDVARLIESAAKKRVADQKSNLERELYTPAQNS